MEVDLIFKIAAVGILVAVLNILLSRSGREEQALMVTIAGLICVLVIVVREISDLFELIKDLFSMELIFRMAAAAILGSCAALLLRRSNPELGLPFSAAVCALCFFAAASLLRPVLELLREASELSGLDAAWFLPVLKCVAIGLISKTASDLCRDAGQSAMAGAVETGGAIAALWTALPLLRTLLGMVRTFCCAWFRSS